MRRQLILLLLLAAASVVAGRAGVITQWDFNSTPPDGNTATGTQVPSFGSGTIAAFGGASGSFAAGSSVDPAPASDNTAFNVGSFPSQSASNKTRGIQINVSTKGFENISLSWEQRASSSSSRYYRLQYTTNGTDYLDERVVTITNASVFLSRSNDLSAINGVRDNPAFGIRLLAEWESTAVGGTTNTNYVGVAGNYSAAGVTRFDMVTIRGTPIPGGNTAPFISSLGPQTTRVDTATSPIPFTMGDLESSPDALLLSATSSNLVLVKLGGITFGGSGTNRTVTLRPEPGETGTTLITLTVTDPQGLAGERSFLLRVLPANTPPELSGIAPQSIPKNTVLTNIAFSITDLETPTTNLILTADSSNPGLIPPSSITFTGTGTNRLLSLSPAPNQTGVAVIKVDVSDGSLSTNVTFAVNVTPSPAVILYDPFDYPDGFLVPEAGHLWTTHSGTPAETTVANGRVEISSINTEDFDAPLRGAPYTNGFLFAKLTVSVVALPTNPEGNFFAHFNASSNFRGRLFATTRDAAEGSFRFGIANTTTNFTAYNRDLTPGVTYTLVIRHDVATGTAALWVDPATEADPFVTAGDATTPASIRAFSFRQGIGLGILEVNDVTVATSFGALFGSAPGFSLEAANTADALEISWPAEATAAGYFLEATSDLAAPDWQPVLEPIVAVAGRHKISMSNATGTRFFRLKK